MHRGDHDPEPRKLIMREPRWTKVSRFDWSDPRTDPEPPYTGPVRTLAHAWSEVSEPLALCKAGRFYAFEQWVAYGRPIQVTPDAPFHNRRVQSLLDFAIRSGGFDLVRLLLCNGYQLDLEPQSPLNAALEHRRWDILDLLLAWGADPKGADVWRVLDSYERDVMERSWSAGVDLTEDASMADALANSTRNRPLYGFVKNYRFQDPRIQRALDVALGASVDACNEKALKLCMWAGANSRQQVADLQEAPEEDEWGETAIERAVSAGAGEFLKPLGFDPARDISDALYDSVRDVRTLGTFVEIKPPKDWEAVTRRFLERLAMSVHFSLGTVTITDIEGVFALGAHLGEMDRSLKRELRQLMNSLGDSDLQRLLRLLSNPDHVERSAYIALIAQEKLMSRYAESPRRFGFDRELLAQIAEAPKIPAAVRRWAKDAVAKPQRPAVLSTSFEGPGGVQLSYSREQIYELVWSEPIMSLSKKFGISDTAIRKRCKSMNIPIPPRGHWQKVKHQKPVRTPPLPQLRPGEPIAPR